MPLSAAALARRVARELAGASRVWLSPDLDVAFFEALPEGVALTEHHPEVAVVLASRLSARGEVKTVEAPYATRLLAVLAAGADIVRQPFQGPRAERVFCDRGVLDVTAKGLILVELAPGVSAADFQKTAEPTLRISPRLVEVSVDSLDERRTEQ